MIFLIYVIVLIVPCGCQHHGHHKNHKNHSSDVSLVIKPFPALSICHFSFAHSGDTIVGTMIFLIYVIVLIVPCGCQHHGHLKNHKNQSSDVSLVINPFPALSICHFSFAHSGDIIV
jgi:amino acid permease